MRMRRTRIPRGSSPRWVFRSGGGDGWEWGHSLTLSPDPQDTAAPVPAPQTASPTEEDRMPPYDEQTQAFINGEG